MAREVSFAHRGAGSFFSAAKTGALVSRKAAAMRLGANAIPRRRAGPENINKSRRINTKAPPIGKRESRRARSGDLHNITHRTGTKFQENLALQRPSRAETDPFFPCEPRASSSSRSSNSRKITPFNDWLDIPGSVGYMVTVLPPPEGDLLEVRWPIRFFAAIVIVTFATMSLPVRALALSRRRFRPRTNLQPPRGQVPSRGRPSLHAHMPLADSGEEAGSPFLPASRGQARGSPGAAEAKGFTRGKARCQGRSQALPHGGGTGLG